MRRVILYKSGVGFFEHVGSVTGTANVTIQFTTAQLNDVLQSLTTLDLDGGSIANISYNSIAPVDQRLAALRVPLTTTTDRIEFFKTLRGAPCATSRSTRRVPMAPRPPVTSQVPPDTLEAVVEAGVA